MKTKMVLVDTSVWVAHLRHGTVGLEALLNEGRVVCHPFIVGELACGNLRNRYEILKHLQALPRAIPAEPEEVMQFIENYSLMGKGLGYIDMHLLASAILTKVPLWTLDKKLNEIAVKLELAP
jgi:predicted nucleic acid-binding protein